MRNSRTALITIASLFAVAAQAADGTWNGPSGSWTDSGNWIGGVVADGKGATAKFTGDITTDTTVTLSAPQSIGQIIFGNSNPTGAGNWRISGDTLTLNPEVGSALITVNNLGTDRIAVIASTLAGTGGLTKQGTGTLRIAGGTTFTGVTNIAGGTLEINHDNTSIYSSPFINIQSGATLMLTGGRIDFGTQMFNFASTGGGRIIVNPGVNWVARGNWSIRTNGGAKNTIGGTEGLNLNSGNSITFDIARGTDPLSDLDVLNGVSNTGGSLTKNGAGILTLLGDNTYGGNTFLSAGTLVLTGTKGTVRNSSINLGGGTLRLVNDAAANNGDRLGDRNSVTINGGSLHFSNTGGDADYSETTGELIVASGAGSITVDSAASGHTSTLNFASLSRTLGTVNFVGTSLGTTIDPRGEIRLTSAPVLTHGLLGGWATVNGTDFATIAGPNNSIVAYSGYTEVSRLGGLITSNDASNLKITNTGNTSGDITLAATGITDINTLLLSTGEDATLAIGDGNTLRMGSSGGVMVAANAGALTITRGTLTAGGAPDTAGVLTLGNHHATNLLTIDSIIADNGAGATSLSTNGHVSLGGLNTYTGATSIGSGVLSVSTLADGGQASGIGASGNARNNLIIANGGTLRYTGTSVSTNRGFTVNGTGTIEVTTAGQTLTMSGGIENTAGNFVKTGAGTLVLSGGGLNQSGSTSVLEGTLRISTGMGNNSGWYVGRGARMELAATNMIVGGHNIAVADSRVFVVDGGTLALDGGVEARLGNIVLSNGGVLSSSRGLNSWDWLLGNVSSGSAATIRVVNSGGNTEAARMNGGGGLHLQGLQNFDVSNVTGDDASDLIVSMTLGAEGQVGGTAGGVVKNGDGTMEISSRTSYTGGTIINAGVLSLTGGGGGAGTIRGTVTVNQGGTLRLAAGDVTGYDANDSSLRTINLNGGTLDVATNAGNGQNQTLGGATINMTGGAITGVAGSNLDFFRGTSALNSLASSTTSVVSGVRLTIRQSEGLTITTADGGAAIDLDIRSVITNSDDSGALIKEGTGTLRLGGTNTYRTGTRVNAGTVITGNAAALGSGDVRVAQGATLRIGDGTVNNVVLGAGADLVVAGIFQLGSGSSQVTLAGDGGFDFTNAVIDLNGVFDTAPGTTSYQLITGGTGNKIAGGATVTGFDHAIFQDVVFDNTGALIFTAIPEPSTYGLLGAGALAVIAGVRRRKRDSGTRA